jgi:hypothetical protein
MRIPGLFRLHRTPVWLRRRVLLHAWWLESFNRLTRHGLSWQLATALLGAFGLSAWLATDWGISILALAERHLFSAGILLALQTALLTDRGRRRWTEFYSQGWLSALPVDQRTRNTIIVLRGCFPAAAALIGITIVLLAAGALERIGAGIVLSVEVSCAVGTIAGVLIGWWLPRRDAPIPRPTSSLLHRRSESKPGLSAISHWPLLQTKVWLQPRSIARLMVVALGLPMDVSANVAVALLWILIVGLYLVVLLRATIKVARQGAKWLQPTPLSFARFAWAVIRYPLLKQLLWTAATACMAIAAGIDPLKALSLAELWLAIFAALSSIALAHASGSPGNADEVRSLSLLSSLDAHVRPCVNTTPTLSRKNHPIPRV